MRAVLASLAILFCLSTAAQWAVVKEVERWVRGSIRR